MASIQSLQWILLQNFVNAITYVKRSPYLSSENQPDQIKTYPGKSHLFASRIFKPSSGKDAKRLPLVIRMHGGGFIMNSPAGDDELARYLADNAQCVVVAMDYSKAPRHPFPAAYEDLIDLTLAAIQDPDLNVDPSKVVLCGTSAGGNLALAIAQDTRLRSKICGVIAVSPPTDLTIPVEEKIKTRPDPSVPDFLASMYGSIVQMYVGGADKSLDDIRLSPGNFAKREDLPKHMYLVGVEHDLLCKEAEVMAEKSAQGVEKRKTEKGWQAGSVRWDHVKGQKHGFENFPSKVPELEPIRLAEKAWLYQAMADWLKDVFDNP